jgi:hypothetical protein
VVAQPRSRTPSIEATSWRVSLEACLLRSDVLRRIGPPRGEFRSLSGASLEFGHRCITRGVLARHVPWLVERGGAGRAAAARGRDPFRPLALRQAVGALGRPPRDRDRRRARGALRILAGCGASRGRRAAAVPRPAPRGGRGAGRRSP